MSKSAPLKHPALVLTGLLLLGAVLRVAFIATEGFWFDEFWIWRQVRMGFNDMLNDMVRGDVHPPLYQLVMWAWARLVGTSELALRLPSAFFGIATIGLIWRIGRQLFDDHTAAWAAAIVAVGEFAIYYSQEARSYSLLFMLSVATASAWVASTREGSIRAVIHFTLVALALAYTHVFGGLFVAYLGLAWLHLRLTRQHGPFTTQRFVLAHIAMAVGYAPWLPAMLAQAARVQEGFWIPVPKVYFAVSYVAKFVGHPVLAGLAALLIGFAVWSVWRAPGSSSGETPVWTRKAAMWWLVGWFVFLLGVPYVISLVSQPVMHDKSAIAALAPIALLVGHGLAQLPVRARLAVAAVWFGLSMWAIVFGNYLTQNREAWREMSVAVAERYEPGHDLAVLYHPDFDYMFCYHFYLPEAVESFELLCDQGDCAAPLAALDSVTRERHTERLWLLKVRASEAFPEGLESRWKVSQEESFNNGVLQMLERR